jgi:chromosome partitioning protein
MKVIGVANQKGGVGKTTLVVNLAAAIAKQAKRVLVVDMDFQANATAAMVGKLPPGEKNMAHVLVGAATMQEILVETRSAGVVLAPASEELSKADLSLATKIGREGFLKRALAPLDGHFDVVLIDTSPYLGLLTVNSLYASDKVLVPLSAEFFSMLGLQLLSDTINEVRTNMDSGLDVLGYLVTMYDRRLAITGEVLKLLEDRFGDTLFKSKIRVNSNLKACPAHQKDIFAFEETTKKPWKGAEDFTAVALEVLERLEKHSNKAAA